MADEGDRSSWHPASMPSGLPDPAAPLQVSDATTLMSTTTIPTTTTITTADSAAGELPDPSVRDEAIASEEATAPESQHLPDPSNAQAVAFDPASPSLHPQETNSHDAPEVQLVQELEIPQSTIPEMPVPQPVAEMAEAQPEPQPQLQPQPQQDDVEAEAEAKVEAQQEDVEAEVEAQQEVADTGTIVEAPADSASPAHKPVAQHASSSSFARTVSHDISFGDDDDPEWSLSRTDTDPFKFMPQPEKTNSFPIVPTIAAADSDLHGEEKEQEEEEEEEDAAPLQFNQAMEIVQEAEKDWFADEEQYQGAGTGAGAGAGLGHPEAYTTLNTEAMETSGHRRVSSHSMGCDVQLPEAAASEARFDEGLPLIPHNGTGQDLQDSIAPSGLEGSFNDNQDDDEEDDGFFGQIREAENDSSLEADDAFHLQRKSTMQVLQAIDPTPLTRQDTPLETPIEADEDRLESPDQREAENDDAANQDGLPREQDLASKWEEAFADEHEDVDFLLDESATGTQDVDAAAFLGSDDEGLLEDDEPALVPAHERLPTPVPVPSFQSAVPLHQHQQPSSLPGQPATSYVPHHQHAPIQPPVPALAAQNPYSALGQMPPAQVPPVGLPSQFGQPPPPQLEQTKAQSFADKSRGGYSSPYDLPTDLIATTVKPRKRLGAQQFPQEPPSQQHPPPRTASMGAPHHPPQPPPPAVSSSALHQKPPTPAARTHGDFFEDLPVTTKLRPTSRQSVRAPSPNLYAPPGPSALGTHMASQAPPHVPPSHPPVTSVPPAVPHLVGPEKVGPYATPQMQGPPAPPPSGGASRYSPAPAHAPAPASTAPPMVANRYSPAPSASRPPSSYNSAPPAMQQPLHSHLPRTSSPLAHFEITSEKAHGRGHAVSGADAAHDGSGTGSPYEPRVTRVPSLPPTREVEEEEEDLTPGSKGEPLTPSPPHPPATSRYSPLPTAPATAMAMATARRTPPPATSGQSTLSPPQPPQRPGSSYVPQAPATAQPSFVPPPRASTQSPGAARIGKHASKTSDPGRPAASQYSPTAPVVAPPSANALPRPLSVPMNMVAPTDGREHDPLQRWQGVPIFSWGVGGTIVTSFPKSVPRYVMNQAAPMMLRNAGEVKVRNIKDIEPLHERLSKFPGPLKGKSKKKEVLTWLSSGIDSLEKEASSVPLHMQSSAEAKRSTERLLLWKVLRVFVEFDGALEGSPAVEKAVRAILSPDPSDEGQASTIPFPAASGVAGLPSTTATSMQSDGVDASAIDQIRRDLLKGDHETAVWAAVDKRLWGHAMLISHTVSPDLYKRVAQEFVRKEVNHPGHSNESLAALYKVLSGNYDDCVDELVPVHARAGLQLVSTEASSGFATGAIDGLDKWRETLTLVLSNRSADDVRGLNALGKLLSGYGRAEAAHICFIFSRSISVFGGIDDPNVDFVLLGSDHRQPSMQFAQDTEALQLSEVFEYGLSLSGAPSFAAGAPHLAAYKLHHVMTLAEYGQRDKALQYCDALITAMSAQTRRSPYHHSILETAVGDLMARLKQAPKEESTSWMSKPTMNKVSDSMWNRFNKFVAGDEQDGNGTAGEMDNGPFARITTPTISRSPSVTNFESFNMTSPTNNYASPPLSIPATNSKYAPQAAQPGAVANPYDPASASAASGYPHASRRSNEYTPGSYEPSYPGANSPPATSPSGYSPPGTGANYGFQSLDAGVRLGTGPESHANAGRYAPAEPGANAWKPNAGQEDGGASAPSYQPQQPLSYGYEPPQTNTMSADDETKETGNGGVSGGYEPPSTQSYVYEPPSYGTAPDASANDDDEDDAPKPKKKSFMDDDDDDVLSTPTTQDKSRAERDRENDELFRKAAEEDAKRAAAQQASKKGWGFTSWFGGNSSKKEGSGSGDSTPGKPIKAKLGEASSFVYDPDLKRWINKKPGAENVEAKSATPPPPKGGAPRSVSGTPPMRAFTPPPAAGRASVPPTSAPAGGLMSPAQLKPAALQEQLGMMRSVSSADAANGQPANGPASGPPSRPPSRPATSVSNASSIDDLLSTSGPRKPGQKKARKGGRYVDVMAK